MKPWQPEWEKPEENAFENFQLGVNRQNYL
jgi:hypothetical protein